MKKEGFVVPILKHENYNRQEPAILLQLDSKASVSRVDSRGEERGQGSGGWGHRF